MHLALLTIVFVAVTSIAGVLFVLWSIYCVIRFLVQGTGSLIGTIFGWPARRTSFLRCTRLRCGEQNPVEARFCRRCGVPLITAAMPQARPMLMQRG
jgi:hypothetical protein